MNFQTASFGKERLLALDLLRTVAALIVAVGHSGALFPRYSDITYTMCVAFFFVLSGFVISHAYGDEISHEQLTLRNYAALRFARLYPLHFLTAVVVVILYFAGRRATGISLLWIFENLTVSQSLITYGWSLNLPAWSIGPEVWGSFLIFALYSFRGPMHFSLICTTAAVFLFFEFSAGFLQSITERYLIGLGCFLLGFAAHRGVIDIIASRIPSSIGWGLAATAFAATIFCPYSIARTPPAELGFYALFTLTVAVLARVRMAGLMADVANASGNISYGVYLWHWPLLLVFRPFSHLGLAVFVTVLIAISWISYVAFERPAKRYFRRLLSTPRGGLRNEPALNEIAS
ncbi:MAG: acyltransferase [Bradyrhizobium sp.]|uniref:acyltransferase family protein n=1 Tax=Bradyrhizobium sp. TaxID=376 RepID=UPI00121357EC|nr:acyltransferase [Bradyrhizobium sp.]THD73150.1 MAG: acyltransferase [Bradyrhizobium sp.]